MKQLSIKLALTLGLLLSIVGCGGDDDKANPPVEIVLDFGTVGDYNLSEYLFPTENQINNYRDKEYKNSEGKREYDNLDANETFYSVRYTVNDDLVKEFREDSLHTNHHIQDDRIKSIIVDNNKTTEIVKYADIDNYIIKSEAEVTVDGRHGTDSIICRISGYKNEKEVINTVYENVLEVSCVIADTSSGTFNGSQFETSRDGVYLIYLAKDIGKISSTLDVCDITTLNSLSETMCKKTVTELTTIN